MNPQSLLDNLPNFPTRGHRVNTLQDIGNGAEPLAVAFAPTPVALRPVTDLSKDSLAFLKLGLEGLLFQSTPLDFCLQALELPKLTNLFNSGSCYWRAAVDA